MRQGKDKLEEEDAARKRRNLRNKKSKIRRKNRRNKRKGDQQSEDGERQCVEPETGISSCGPVKKKRSQSWFLNSAEKGIVTASSPTRTDGDSDGMGWNEEDVQTDRRRRLRSVVEVKGTVENDEPGPRLKLRIVVPSRDRSSPQSLESNKPSGTNLSRGSHSSIHKHECQDGKYKERSYNGKEENGESDEREKRHAKVKLKDEIERKEYEVEAADKRSRSQSMEVQERAEYEHHIISEFQVDRSLSQNAVSNEQSSAEDGKRYKYDDKLKKEDSKWKIRHEKENVRNKKEKHRDKCEPKEPQSHATDTWQDPLGQLGPTQLPEWHNPAHNVAAFEDVDEHYDGVLAAHYLSSTDISKELTDPGTYKKCQWILMKYNKKIGTNYEADHEEVIRQEVTVATPIPSSLLPCPDKSVFQRAMSLYKKQIKESRSLLESYPKGVRKNQLLGL